MKFILSKIYEVAIFLLEIGIKLLALFNHKAKKRNSGNDHWKYLQANQAKLAWFHCASLGEFEQGRPVLEAFKLKYPAYKILLTFFSPSGFEIRKNYPEADYITYLPLDSASNARAFIEHFQPSLAFFVKYEFWRNYALELRKHKIPLISFSTIFRENQVYFKPWGRFFRQTLEAFDHFFVQNKSSEQLLIQAEIQNVTIAGDTRFDRVNSNKESSQPIPRVDKFAKGSETIVVGSAWQQDMSILIPVINDDAFKHIKFIIAPHEINAEEIEKWTKEIKGRVQRYSTFDSKRDSQVLFIDNIGMLSAIYQYGYAAYIGGAFGKGLHNILEAAVFEIPVYFGNKNYQKFQEANELLALGTAKTIANSDQLKNELLALENKALRKSIKEKNATFIQHHLGASQKVLDYCSTLLKK